MAMISNDFYPKKTLDFFCEKCNFISSNKKDFNRHIQTKKHNDNGSQCFSVSITQQVEKKPQSLYMCICGKKYKDNSGFWRHKNKGICVSKNNFESENENKNEVVFSKPIDTLDDKDQLILMLIKQNSELIKETSDFKNMMLKVIENGTMHNTTNNTTHTNSHNKAFNLNFFLNETCKDAMNIMDFVESIKLQLSDLEKMGEVGYVEGISNIIVKNLNALDVSQRPVHCTDKKRETIYIKDEDKWEKDEEQKKIRKVIKKVANKNAMLIQEFKEKHPDYNKYHSKYSTQYHKLIIESFGGSGNNDLEKEDKIIRNISKNIVVDK